MGRIAGFILLAAAITASGKALLAVVFGCVVWIWAMRQDRGDAVPRHLAILLAAYTFASILPTSISFPVQLAAVAGAFAEYAFLQRRPGTERIVFWSVLILVAWCAFALNANVPSLSIGLLGVRKSVFAVAGLVLGCSIPKEQIRSAERLVVQALTAALAASIAIHQYFPEIESSVARAANHYTAQFDGVSRLQGVFAGPFHVALAGVFIVGWAGLRFREQQKLALGASVVGTAAVYLTLVRTAYVALAAVLIVQILVAPNARTRFRRTGAVLLAFLFVLAVFGVNEDTSGAARSLLNATDDSRLQNRIPEYQEGIRLVVSSPLYGWGAGSAGDTLGRQFGPGLHHVTAHNIVLRIIVEGGLVGFLLWIGLTGAIARRMQWIERQGQMAAVAATAIGVFGLTGSIVEALPVSYLLLAVIGLAVNESPPSKPDGEALPDAGAMVRSGFPSQEGFQRS